MTNEDQNFEEKIRGLLGTLNRVNPPGDFDFKVRARIAKGQPSTAGGSWLPASVKLAIPLGMLAVGGYFGFNAINSSAPTDQPAAAVVQVPAAQPAPFVPLNEEPIAPASESQPEVARVRAPETRSVARPVTGSVKKTSTARRAPEPEGGSVDSAARETKSIFPVGVTPNANIPPVTPNGSTSVVRITGKDVLSRIGVSAVLGAGGWHVQSVNATSAAGRAGLQAGDVIEAVNGSAMPDKAMIDQGFAAKGLRVRRNGRTVFIGLTP